MADNGQNSLSGGNINGNLPNNQQGFTDTQRQELQTPIIEGIAAARPRPEQRPYQYERGPGNQRCRIDQMMILTTQVTFRMFTFLLYSV